ncbi:MAG: hypothetical protein ABL921_00830 [Pirellula sp.]
MEQSGSGDETHFLASDGQSFQVPLADIDKVEPAKQSIMPDGLETTLTREEFADLLAFLLTP